MFNLFLFYTRGVVEIERRFNLDSCEQPSRTKPSDLCQQTCRLSYNDAKNGSMMHILRQSVARLRLLSVLRTNSKCLMLIAQSLQ